MIGFALAILLVPTFALAQNVARTSPGPSKPFPDADFVLHDKDLKPQKNGIVLGPMHSDGKGGTTGTFAIYGGGLPIEVSSMSFSGDGKLLAVGSTPGIVDLWDVEAKKKVFSLKGGTAVGLSLDGRTLAIDGKGIEVYDVASGKLKERIPRTPKRPENVIDSLSFSPDGVLLDVTANGDEDMVYEVSSGRLVATLQNTQHSRFSLDGSLLIGGNA